MKAGPLKQPVPPFLMSECCESRMLPGGGYLGGAWSDFVGFTCPDCGKVWYWKPDKPDAC
jgi:hypothetical protein